jgi:hypothetical protein
MRQAGGPAAAKRQHNAGFSVRKIILGLHTCADP